MDRYAVLIDVGYVATAGAELVAGTASRSLVEYNYTGLLKELTAETANHSELPLLRTYW